MSDNKAGKDQNSNSYKSKIAFTERYLDSLPIKLKDRCIKRFHSKSKNTGIVDESMINELETYQEAEGLAKDGKFGDGTIRSLRNNDRDSFKHLSEYNYADEDSVNNMKVTKELIGEQTPVKSRIICEGVTNCDAQSEHSIPRIDPDIYGKIVNTINSSNPQTVIKQDMKTKKIVAIRGAFLQGNSIIQSDSARRYMNYFYGHGTREDGRHFSTRYIDGSKPGSEFDDIFLTLWQEDPKICFAQARKGSVDPNSMFPQGTSHLLDGKYDYKLRIHKTTHFDHMRGILKACANDPSIIDTLEIKFLDKAEKEIKDIKIRLKEINKNLRTLIDDNKKNNKSFNASYDKEFRPLVAKKGLYFVNQEDPFKSFYGEEVTVETNTQEVTSNITAELLPVMNSVKNGSEILKKITVKGFSNTFINNNLSHYIFTDTMPGIQMNHVVGDTSTTGAFEIAKICYLGFISTTDSVRENNDINDGILIKDGTVKIENKAQNGLNIHTSSNERASSEGCQNIPIAQYVNFIREIREGKAAETNDNNAAQKASKPNINYILTDASKIK